MIKTAREDYPETVAFIFYYSSCLSEESNEYFMQHIRRTYQNLYLFTIFRASGNVPWSDFPDTTEKDRIDLYLRLFIAFVLVSNSVVPNPGHVSAPWECAFILYGIRRRASWPKKMKKT